MTAEAEGSVSDVLDLSEAVARLVRGDWSELESCLVTHESAVEISDSKSTLRCNFLRSDPNDRVRLKALAEQLVDQLVHYCIPRTAIEDARNGPPDRLAVMSRDVVSLDR